jgi:hypothetical protein
MLNIRKVTLNGDFPSQLRSQSEHVRAKSLSPL